MSDINGLLLGIGFVLPPLTYLLGVELQALPIPYKSIKVWAPTLMMDAIVSEFVLLSVGLVSNLVQWISGMIQQSIATPFNSLSVAMATILAQLTALDASLLLLISLVSSTVILAPVANALSSILGPALTWITIAIIIWLMVQMVSSYLPSVWLSAYILGVVFMAIPLRLGRRFGTLLMSSSIVLAIGLPLMPSLAIWLEGFTGYETALKPLQDILRQIPSNPLLIGKLLATLPLALGNLLSAVVISLVIFPFAYLFILSLFTRSVASVIGGASSGPAITNFVTAPSREIGQTFTSGERD